MRKTTNGVAAEYHLVKELFCGGCLSEEDILGADHARLCEAIALALRMIPKQYADVVELRYGFPSGQLRTYREIGMLVGCQQQWVRQKLCRGIRELRAPEVVECFRCIWPKLPAYKKEEGRRSLPPPELTLGKRIRSRISVRAGKALVRSGCNLHGDVSEADLHLLSRSKLLAQPNCGWLTVNEIEEALRIEGITLQD